MSPPGGPRGGGGVTPVSVRIGGDQDFLYFVCIDGISYLLKFEHVESIFGSKFAPFRAYGLTFCLLLTSNLNILLVSFKARRRLFKKFVVTIKNDNVLLYESDQQF